MAAKAKVRKADGPPSQRPKKHRKTQAIVEQPIVASKIETLPTEVLFMIAHSLPSATDITRLARTSKTMTSVLNDADKSFWWQYFSSMFDKHDSSPSASDFARQSRIYQYLMKGFIFQDDGRRGPWCDKRTFTAIKLLINEAYSNGKQQSENIGTMTTLVKEQNLFGNLFRPPYYRISVYSQAMFLGPALLTMLHVGLDVWTPGLQKSVYSFADSKTAAYHHPHVYPLFITGTGHSWEPSVMMRPHATNLLYIANFFRFYFHGTPFSDEIAQLYSHLPAGRRPTAWLHDLQSNVNPLKGTTHWKGCTSHVNHNSLKRWRAGGGKVEDNGFMTESDDFDEETLRALGFLDLRLDFLEEGRRYFPNEFQAEIKFCDEALEGLEEDVEGFWTDKPDSVNAPFIGFSRSATGEIVNGNMHLLNDTAGIQGFKRISWICTAADDTNLASSTAELLSEVNSGASVGRQAWAYEGVMLPGGNIMIGRWWDGTYHEINSVLSSTTIRTHAVGQTPDVPMTMTDLKTAAGFREMVAAGAELRLNSGPFIYWRVKDGPADGVGST